MGKKDDGASPKKDAHDELKAKPHEIKKAAKPPIKPSAQPPVKAKNKEEPKKKGVLSKITDSVADTVKGTIEILTPESKEDKAKKAEQKANAKTIKIEPKKSVKSANSIMRC